METFNHESYTQAIIAWKEAKMDPLKIADLFPQNFIFNLSYSQIQWLKEFNRYKEFCVDIGVLNAQLVFIFVPLDETGLRTEVDEYFYSVFEELKHELVLTEKKTYTTVKQATLSKNLRVIEKDAEVFLPITEKPIMEQTKAINAIELWQNSGLDWFYAQYKSEKVDEIFNKFYVPSEKILEIGQEFSFVGLFGLNFSDIYQKQLPTLIFISQDNSITPDSSRTISNTYDWAKPCPPICKIPEIFIEG